MNLLLAEIAYILMGLMFLMMGQYLVVIMMIVVFIFATKLQNDFKKWVFKDEKN